MVPARRIGACGSPPAHIHAHEFVFAPFPFASVCVCARGGDSVHLSSICSRVLLKAALFYTFFFSVCCALHAGNSLFPSMDNLRVEKQRCAEEAVRVSQRREQAREEGEGGRGLLTHHRSSWQMRARQSTDTHATTPRTSYSAYETPACSSAVAALRASCSGMWHPGLTSARRAHQDATAATLARWPHTCGPAGGLPGLAGCVV